jgi:hypothetical protein
MISVSGFPDDFRFTQQEAANSRPKSGDTMAFILHLQHSPRQTLERVNAMIGAIARAVAAERLLALRAATKAASPRQRLAEVRAMYVPSLDLNQQSDFVARADRLEKI